jgi:hypothetical protein
MNNQILLWNKILKSDHSSMYGREGEYGCTGTAH